MAIPARRWGKGEGRMGRKSWWEGGKAKEGERSRKEGVCKGRWSGRSLTDPRLTGNRALGSWGILCLWLYKGSKLIFQVNTQFFFSFLAAPKYVEFPRPGIRSEPQSFAI